MIIKAGASPLTPLHIAGEENPMTNIPSRLFGSNLAWFKKNDTDLLNLFNKNFPLAKSSLLDLLQTFQHREYQGYFSAADAAFRNGRIASTQKSKENMLEKVDVTFSDLWE